MLGSVLCSPGCFTIYRASALVDVLPEYASQVKEAFEFLIKEMGEDRYLTVLMVKEHKQNACKPATNLQKAVLSEMIVGIPTK